MATGVDYERLRHDYERLKTVGETMRAAQKEFHGCEPGSSRRVALVRKAKAAEKSYDKLIEELDEPRGLFKDWGADDGT